MKTIPLQLENMTQFKLFTYDKIIQLFVSLKYSNGQLTDEEWQYTKGARGVHGKMAGIFSLGNKK